MGSGGSTLKGESAYVLSVEKGWKEGTETSAAPQERKRSQSQSKAPVPESKIAVESPVTNRKVLSTTSPGNVPVSSISKVSGGAGQTRSIAAASRTVQPSAGVARDLVRSEKFSWLINGGDFSALNLGGIENGRIIGKGLMGTVRLARVSGKNPAYFALKSIRKDYIHKHRDQRHVAHERDLLQQLSNPFCIKLFRTYQDANNIYFAMKLAVGGELFRRLSKKACFLPQVAKFYVCEIFSAIKHVQSLGYVYRDLKPENVMLDEDGHCLLVDFGFSTIPDENGQMKTMCGTPAYLSPEQLDGKFTNGYQKIVDWWSLGILIFELLTGQTPFCNNPRETHYEIYLRILKNQISFPSGFDADSKNLVQRLCHPEVPKRLTDPDEIARHQYFTVPWNAVNARKLIPPFVPRIKEEKDKDHYFNQYQETSEPADSADSCKMDLDGF